jgi:N-acetylglucosamine kinase-like BadF-type ATPase
LKLKNPKYIIGIDAGATSSDVMLYSLDSGSEKHLSFPPVNFNVAGKEDTINILSSIIRRAAKTKGTDNIAAVCAGIAGARHEKDRKFIKKELSKIFPGIVFSVYPDTAIAFAAIFNHHDTNCGILIAGTGSILYYTDSKGEIKKVGGWGRFIDDEGSGYWIGREALNRAVKCFDGRIKKTKIADALHISHKLNDSSIIKEVYHNKFEISKAAKIVFECAEKGDKESIKIIQKASELLAEHLHPFKNKKAVIALCGSLFTKEKLLEKYFRKIIRKKYPLVKLIKPKRKPVWGAVEIAMFTAGLKKV